MSLLNSVLSSINGSQATASNPSVSKPSLSVRKENGVPAATPPQALPTIIASKRKAEDSGRDVKPKLARVETKTTLAPPPSRSATASPAQRQGAPLPKAQMPYRGTAGPSISKPVSTSVASTRPVASAPTTPSIAPPIVAKTGYLAVLERAKAAQAATNQIGQIKHKPVEKLTKKDRLRMQAEAAAAAKGKKPVSKAGSQALKGRSKSVEPVDLKTGAPIKEKRKVVDVGYKGTMRAAPTAPSYSGTMRGSGAVSRKSAPPPKEASYRYADYSDEEDEEEEEENYDSESDMEAGLDEVDFEEQESTRLAKKEDAEALRLENQLKKEKAEKKRKLEQMAAAAGAKKKRY